MTANGVSWGTRSALVATLSHFLELDDELELLGSGISGCLLDPGVRGLRPTGIARPSFGCPQSS
jgi:hypothetical protein